VPNAYVIAVSAIQPFSRGSVRLAGPTPELPPVIDPNYLGDARDIETLVEGISIARDIGTAPALDPWRGAELGPGPQLDSREAHCRNSSSRPRAPTSTRQGHAPWATASSQWSMKSFASAASPDYGSSMHPSCPRYRRTTRWQPSMASQNAQQR
jgi:choline dehydrogenase-like flavoprotein